MRIIGSRSSSAARASFIRLITLVRHFTQAGQVNLLIELDKYEFPIFNFIVLAFGQANRLVL